jgi:putative ABC transport system permease protein
MNRNNNHPPRTALFFLRFFCPEKLHEGIEGDLLEQFERDQKERGKGYARMIFFWHVFRFLRPGIIFRNKFSSQLINTIMLRNYFTIAFRSIFKNKVFSAINVFGLGLGMAACLMIFQFVSFELSYDQFNEQLDRTYRVTNDRFQNGKLIQHGTIMYPTIGPTMAKDFPEIETYTRLMPGGPMNVKADDRLFRGDNCYFADERFLTVFTFPLIAGDKNTALKDRYSAVLTPKTAKKFFKLTDQNVGDALGKTFYWGLDQQPYKVTGVCEAIPENSHINFDVLVSYSTLFTPEQHDADDSWTWSDMRHYLVLKPGVNYKTLESKFPDFSERYFKGNKVSGSIEKFYLQPMKEAHLYSDYEYDIARTASGKAVWAMLLVAGFILLIAWINYINLTTSRALDRAKEVGLRKVMGALRSQLIKQFIFESLMITFFALAVAIIIVQSLQKPFNSIVGSNLSLWNVLSGLDSKTILLLAGTLIAGILLSGFYPAFVLSSYQPVTVLKGKFQRSSKGQFLRKSLVVFQFTASAALITGAVIVSRQLKYMNDSDLGIRVNNTLIVQPPERTSWDSTFIERVESYKQELTKIKGVVGATTSGNIPGQRLGRSFNIRLSDQPSETRYTFSVMGVDYNFMDTYGINLLAGRKFLPTDHKVRFQDLKSVIINEHAAKLLGIDKPQEAVGRDIAWGTQGRLWTIIGVVNDFHQESLKKPMEAIAFRPVYSTENPTSIRIEEVDKREVLGQVEATFKKFFPDNSFDYFFLEDSYRTQYNDDNRFGTIVTIFTVLAIIISCLGLIGLSSYTAVQRTKEIGVRKVLGASLVSIVSLLSVDFMKLVVLAALLSLPIAFFGIQNWLEGYAYKIPLSWIYFVLPVMLILLIAILTISIQVLKAAMTSPAETLKCE